MTIMTNHPGSSPKVSAAVSGSTTTEPTPLPSVAERWNEANFAEMVRCWKFTADQQAKMKELQHMLGDISHWKNDPFEVARYLVEYGYNVNKAASMFRNMVEWRIEEQVDDFLVSYGTPPLLFQQYLPLYMLRDLDHDGDPISVVRLGAMDAWGLYQTSGGDNTTGQALEDYMRFVQELSTTRYLPTVAAGYPPQWNWQTTYYEGHPRHARRKRLTQCTMVVDLQGLNRRQHLRPALFGVLQRIARIAQDMYAGHGKRILILRAPAIFKVGWAVAKHFFDAHIQQLITFATCEDYLEVCAQYMDVRALPACINPISGQGQPMPGYFEHVTMESGPVPANFDYKDNTTQLNDKYNTFQRKDTADLSLEEDSDEDEPASPQTSVASAKASFAVRTKVMSLGTSLCKGHWDSTSNQVVLLA
jgi:hypothetical protein